MSEATDRFLQNTDDGAFMYVSNPELYKRICGYMDSFANEHHQHKIREVLEEEEKRLGNLITTGLHQERHRQGQLDLLNYLKTKIKEG